MTDEKDLSRRDFLATGVVGLGTLATSQVGCGDGGPREGIDPIGRSRSDLQRPAVTTSVQPNWRWCRRCAVLFYRGNGNNPCPAPGGGNHDPSASGNYVLVKDNAAAPGQAGWKQCNFCAELAFHGSQFNAGVCPANGGSHAPFASFDYKLRQNDASAPGQSGWRWCSRCASLFYGASSNSFCPAPGGGAHDSTGSGNYVLMQGDGVSEDVTVNGTAVNVGILAVHAALLPLGTSGKVLYFSGNDYVAANVPAPPNNPGNVDHTRLFDLATNAVQTITPAPLDPESTTIRHDLFCCGHALLGDGRLLAAGGTEAWRDDNAGTHIHHWPGKRCASIFQLTGTQWLATGEMRRSNLAEPLSGGRWYPTLLTLGDGKVIAMCGHPASKDARHSNTDVERYDPSTASWSLLTQEPPAVVDAIGQQVTDPFLNDPLDGGFPEQYPRLHLLPDGTVLCVRLAGYNHPDGIVSDVTYRFNVSSTAWTALCAAPPDYPPDGHLYSPGYFFLGSTVMLPLRAPDYVARVVSVGEEVPLSLDLGANGSTDPANQTSPNGWLPMQGRGLPSTTFYGENPPRRQCNTVLLPDGTFLVIGGAATHDFSDRMQQTAVMPVEMYDPTWNAWFTLASIRHARGYHTVALLLPDGRVWIAGSSEDTRPTQIEIFSPPYLSRGPRPTISSIPTPFAYNSSRTINTPDAASIVAVTLLRCSSVTHGFSSDQRCVELSITARAATQLTVSIPANRNVLPPGYYMLFLLNNFGVPSVARFIQLT